MNRHRLIFAVAIISAASPLTGCKEKPEVASDAGENSTASRSFLSGLPAAPSGTVTFPATGGGPAYPGGETARSTDPWRDGASKLVGPNLSGPDLSGGPRLSGGTFDFNTVGPAAPQATPSGTGLNPLIGIDFKPGTGDVQFVSEFDPNTREVRIVDKAAPGTVEEILERMKGAEQKSPSLETERMWVQAREMVNKNQLSEALTLFGKMREANPKDVRAQIGEGIVYLRRKDYKLALGTLEYAVRSDPKMEDAYWFLAQTHLALENPSAALEDYGALLRLNPDNAEALMSRLSLLYNLRRYSELIADANKLISLRPSVPEGYLYRGVGYLLTSRTSEGQKDFEQAVRVGLSKDVEKILRPRFFPVVP